jgi:hypothetical protein
MDRRKRNTRLRIEATMHRRNGGTTKYGENFIHASARFPNGFRIPSRPSKSPGVVPTWMLTSRIIIPESHARLRHLLEGSLPSGKSRKA